MKYALMCHFSQAPVHTNQGDGGTRGRGDKGMGGQGDLSRVGI